MLPLTFCTTGESAIIKKIGGRADTKQFLENLGFVVGGEVKVISTINGDLILNIKESRVALSKEMASKIMV